MKVNACGNKVFCSQKCEEAPEYSHCGMFIEGVENVVPEMPGLGGKVRRDTLIPINLQENTTRSKVIRHLLASHGIRFSFT